MKERSIINIQRDLADDRESVFMILEIENPHILGEQASNGVERQPPHGCFNTLLMEFFDQTIAPLPSKSPFGQVPSAPG